MTEKTKDEWIAEFRVPENKQGFFLSNLLTEGGEAALEAIKLLEIEYVKIFHNKLDLAYDHELQKEFRTLAANATKSPVAIQAIKELSLNKKIAYDPKLQESFDRLAANCEKTPETIKAIMLLRAHKDLADDAQSQEFFRGIAYEQESQDAFDVLAANCKKSIAAIQLIVELELPLEMALVKTKKESFPPFIHYRDGDKHKLVTINIQEQFDTLAANLEKSPVAMKAIIDLNLDRGIAIHRLEHRYFYNDKGYLKREKINRRAQFDTLAANCEKSPAAIQAIRELELPRKIAYDQESQTEFGALAANCQKYPAVIQVIKDLRLNPELATEESMREKFIILAKLVELPFFERLKDYLVANKINASDNIFSKNWLSGIVRTATNTSEHSTAIEAAFKEATEEYTTIVATEKAAAEKAAAEKEENEAKRSKNQHILGTVIAAGAIVVSALMYKSCSKPEPEQPVNRSVER